MLERSILIHAYKKLITYRKPNLSSTAKLASQSLLNTSASASNKAIQGLAAHQSETNETNNRYINIMEAQQSINFIFADIRLRNRRMRRSNQEHARLVATGKQDGYFRIAWGCVVDYTLLMIDITWGIVQPIVLILVMLIMRIVLITVFTLLGFYILYEIIFS